MKYIKTILFIFLISTLSSHAKENEDLSFFDKVLIELGLDDDKFDESKTIDFSIIPGPFYNPEMSFGIGVSAVGLYRADKQDKETQISSLVINGFGSVNGSFGAQIKNKTFFNKDTLRLFVDGGASRSVESFYGIGEPVNRNDGNAFDYDKNLFQITPALLKKIAPSTFLGPQFHLSYTNTNDVKASANRATYPQENDVSFPNKSTISGLGFRIFHDSRDFILNASEGRFIDLSVFFYEEEFGSKAEFRKILLEWSEYINIGKADNDVLAFQFRTESNKGNVPWDQHAFIGGSFGLRGYYEGRYRDENMALAQLEWRHRIKKPHGMALWIGGAVLAPEYSELTDARVLKNAGIGYRLEVKERVNVRFDYGLGDGESGFYMNISEAF